MNTLKDKLGKGLDKVSKEAKSVRDKMSKGVDFFEERLGKASDSAKEKIDKMKVSAIQLRTLLEEIPL